MEKIDVENLAEAGGTRMCDIKLVAEKVNEIIDKLNQTAGQYRPPENGTIPSANSPIITSQ